LEDRRKGFKGVRKRVIFKRRFGKIGFIPKEDLERLKGGEEKGEEFKRA